MPESCLIFRRWNTIDGGATKTRQQPQTKACQGGGGVFGIVVTVWYTLAGSTLI